MDGGKGWGGNSRLLGVCLTNFAGVPSPRGVLEFQLSRGYDLIPKDSNGLSDPYVLVKYGTRVMFRSKVVKKSLNPEWNQVASLTAPAPEETILVVSIGQLGVD